MSVLSKKIEILSDKKTFAPKVLDDGIILDQTSKMLAESFKLIDFSQQQQVFNGPLDDPRMTLEIKRRKQLGSGAQGDVFEVKVKGLRGEFVDKTRQIYKNPKLAKEILEEMFGEFLVAKDL